MDAGARSPARHPTRSTFRRAAAACGDGRGDDVVAGSVTGSGRRRGCFGGVPVGGCRGDRWEHGDRLSPARTDEARRGSRCAGNRGRLPLLRVTDVFSRRVEHVSEAIAGSGRQLTGTSRRTRAQSKVALPGGKRSGSSKKDDMAERTRQASTCHASVCSSVPSSDGRCWWRRSPSPGSGRDGKPRQDRRRAHGLAVRR